MIPVLLIIIGAIFIVWGLLWMIEVLRSPLIILKMSLRGQVVVEESDKVKDTRNTDRRKGRNVAFSFLFLGIVCFMSGWYLGYSDEGDSFWLNELIYGKQQTSHQWDHISDDGKYISENGSSYSYYLVIRGNDYEFCSQSCDGINDLKDRLSKIQKENTVMIIDSFAVSSRVHEAEILMDDMGIKHEMEEA